MTAKEMAENALMLAQDGHPIFWFEPDEFRDFVDQLCREQREKSANEFNNPLIKDNIMNAPMPEL